MTPEIQKAVATLCGGNEDAVRLIFDVWAQVETWDDLVDQDKPVAPQAVNSLMTWAIFELPLNPIYQTFPQLQFLFRVVVSNWFASNALEKRGSEGKARAYSLRCSPYDFFVGVVLIVSGAKAADDAALFFRSLPTGESFDQYMKTE